MTLHKVETKNKNFFSQNNQTDYYANKTALMPPEDVIFEKYISPNCKVLDIGCGTGRTTKHIYETTKDVIGVDISESMVQAAQKLHSNIEFEVMSATDIKYPDNQFDVVVFSYNGIDYIYPKSKRMQALTEINRVLKVDGFFIYSTHTKSNPFFGVSSLLNFMANIFTLRWFGNYQYDIHRDGILINYSSTESNEKKTLDSLGYEHIKTSKVKGWNYYVFAKK